MAALNNQGIVLPPVTAPVTTTETTTVNPFVIDWSQFSFQPIDWSQFTFPPIDIGILFGKKREETKSLI